MKNVIFLLGLLFAMVMMIPQADAGPPGKASPLELSMTNLVIDADVLAVLPDNALQLVAYEVSYVPIEQVFIRAVLQGFPVQVYDPPNYTMKLREGHNRIRSLINQNHQKVWLRDNRISKNISHPIDPPHY